MEVTLSTLPDDCLRIIFLHLPAVERIKLRRVCRQWKRISDDCWRNIRSLAVYCCPYRGKKAHVWGNSRKITVNSENEGILLGFARCCLYITDLQCFSNVEKFSILPAMKLCRNIRTLNIAVNSDSDDALLANLFAANRHIECLIVRMQNGRCKCLKTLSTNFLKKLHISVDSSQTEKSQQLFAAVIKEKIHMCQSLEELVLNCPGNDAVFKKIGEKMTLKILHITCKETGHPHLTPSGLNDISKLCNLEAIRISVHDELVTDTFLKNLGKHCVHLQSIILSLCSRVTDEGLRALTLLPKLKDLEIILAPFITDTYLRYFSKIECLTIVYSHIRDAGVTALVRESTCLRYLDLYGSSITSDSIRVAAEIVRQRSNVHFFLGIDNEIDCAEFVNRETLPDNLRLGIQH